MMKKVASDPARLRPTLPQAIQVKSLTQRLTPPWACRLDVSADGPSPHSDEATGKEAPADGPRLVPQPNSTALVPQGQLEIARTIWTIGVFEGPPEEEFGSVVAAAFDQHNNVYVLDATSNSLRAFNSDGQFVRAHGRSGRGPGEFAQPTAMRHDGDSTLYVLDSVNGLVVFLTQADGPHFERTVKLPVMANDFCFIEDQIYLLGVSEENFVHQIDPGGSLKRSFGGLFGPEGNAVQGIISMHGRIACMPDRGTVIVASRLLPAVRAYSTRDERLLWEDSLRNFVSAVIQTQEGGSYSMWTLPEGAAQTASFTGLGPDRLLAQARRAPTRRALRTPETTPFEVITSCFIQLPNGACNSASAALPLLLAVKDDRAIALEDVHFPIVSLVELRNSSR